MLQTQFQEEPTVTAAGPAALRQAAATELSGSYDVRQHPAHPRLKQIDVRPPILTAFFGKARQIDVQNLEYVPFMRFILADWLDELIGDGFRRTICDVLLSRSHGGFTLGTQETAADHEDYIKLATAVSHLVGPANRDAMSGSYVTRFDVKHTDESDSYLRQAYHTLTLHTDGTFADERTDWLLMMKMAEQCAEGGESRLLHLDDWSDLARFYRHPLGSHGFTFKASPSKNVERSVRRPTFYRDGHGIGISYVDQFMQPETPEQARYLCDLSQSLENSPGIRTPRLAVGTLIMLNNHFWMHGRAPFRRNEQLHRELMRQRGAFASD